MSKKIEWSGYRVSMGFDTASNCKELGFREDGVLVWRKATPSKNSGRVVKESKHHKVEKCRICNHSHPIGKDCGLKLDNEELCNCNGYQHG